MSEFLFLVPIALFLVVGVMSPGPSFLLVAQTAMAKTRAQAIAVAFGMGVGATVFAIVASLGLFVLLNAVPWLYLALKVMGGSYLCYLAYKMWQSAATPLHQAGTDNAANDGILKMFFVGLFTQLSNPKTAIVFGSAFAAFLPQQVPDYSYLIISTMAFLIDSLWYVIVAIFLSTPKAQNAYGRFKKYLCRTASGIMALMGIKLIAS